MAVDIEKAKLKALMRLKPTLEDTAAFFECSTKSIQRHIRDEYDLDFVQFREQNMVHTRLSLIRKAIEKAEKGDNVMLIFCLKNVCGWKDKWDNDPAQPAIVQQLNITDEQLEKLVKSAKAKA